MGKLGYSSITLTDLTQTLPVSLTLESNLNKNIQIKTGTLYEPDFREKISPEEDFEGVVITPSLFLGQEDLEIENNEIYVNPNFNDEARTSGFIYYEIGNTIYKYDKNITTGIYVDLQGRLHIEENLNENTTIEAYIEDFKVEVHAYTDPLVSAINPITILLLEEGSSNYQAMIDCSDGREHFEDTNASPITMTASLWKGNEQIPVEQLLYSWDKLGDGDSIADGNDSSLIVERKSITNREYFTCIITDTATGLTYSASQFIYDFTDIYACDISYNKMPLLTDKNTEIILTTNVWNKGKLLESGKDGFILSYDWFARGIVSEKEVTLIENSIEPTLELNVSGIQELQYQDFVVYCKVYQTDSAGTRYPIAGGTLNIHYTVQYNVRITPQTFFIPTSNAGFYQGKEPKIYNFTFQLLDPEGNILPYEKNKDTVSAGNQEDETVIILKEVNEEKKEWNFNGEIDFTASTLWEQTNLTSQIYEFTYTYLGQEFSEEINIVKSYVGEQGFSGYTIDLSNNFHAFSGGESIADPGQIVETDISAFYGDQNLEILEVKINNNGDIIYSSDGVNTPVLETNVKNLIISARAITDNSIRITMKTGERGSSATTEGNTLTFIIKVKHPEKNEILNIVKTFTYIINYEGKSYYLSTDYNNIIYSEANGTYEPSPSQGINVYSLYRGEKGEALTYEIGKIIYSLNEGKTWNYLGGSSGRITNYSGLKNIQIRLYGSASTVDNDPNDLENNKKYLYDMETIPILTSLEGYEIGGENLLKWTKELPIETNKWKASSTIETIKEGEFGIFNFNVSTDSLVNGESWHSVKSSKIEFSQDYLGKSFCISFYIKVESTSAFNGTFGPYLVLNSDYNNTDRERYGAIFTMRADGTSAYGIKLEKPLESNVWTKVYYTFTIPTEDSSSKFGDTDLETILSWKECKYMSIYFYISQDGKLQIKKPKLEMGNIPTDWSPSPSDIDYNFLSSNLISDSYSFSIKNKDPYKILNAELFPNQSYALSWYEVEKINNSKEEITWSIFNNSTSQYIKSGSLDLNKNKDNIFTMPSEKATYSLRLYAGLLNEDDFILEDLQQDNVQISKDQEFIFKQIKLELGNYSTNYVINSEELFEKIQSQDQEINDYLTIINQNGEKINIQKNEFNAFLTEYTKTKTTFENEISQNTSEIFTNEQDIQTINKHFRVVTEGPGSPFIELIVNPSFNDYNVIQMRLKNDDLIFYKTSNASNLNTEIEEEDKVAYFGGNKLFIKQADILNTIRIGSKNNGGFLVITTQETSGVTFTWASE